MKIRSMEQLINYIKKGNETEYLFFWGHRKSRQGVGKSCFSQWYEAPFEYDGNRYLTAEHFMMAEKARLFNDDASALKVISAGSAAEAKKIGRQVKGFDEAIWLQHRFDIVVKANLLKFSQNKECQDYLFSTGECVLVEASPVDSIWGVGLAADDPRIENPESWQGLNLLGFALMEVREQLACQGEATD